MTDVASAAPSLARAGRRLRLLTIVVLAAIAVIELVTSSQQWWSVRLAQGSIPVPGTTASPGLTALALAGLALALALAIAGPVFRFILGVLQVLVGVTVVVSSAFALADPARASEALISQSTGVSGSAPILALVAGVALSPWGWIAVATGGVSALSGLFVLATFRAWPAASRKYQATRFVPADGSVVSGTRDSVIAWDTLSEGEDPTNTR